MRMHEAAVASFGRHETFHPRYGWLRKGFDAAIEDPEVFLDKAAPVRLGVGKNMVKAIRFWGLATKTTTEVPHPTMSRRSIVVPTGFGEALLADNGVDRYLEDPGSIWLLHWMLHAPQSLVPVSWAALSVHSAIEFNNVDLRTSIDAELERTASWKQPHTRSVERDLSVFFRMYGPVGDAGRSGIDSVLDSPFRELGLIRPSAVTAGAYRFNVGPKPTLPDEILAVAALDYLLETRIDEQATTVLVSRLANDPGSPGRIFKVTETDLAAAFDRLASVKGSELSMSSPTGVAQLGWSAPLPKIAERLLGDYYDQQIDAAVIGPDARRAQLTAEVAA